MALTKDRLQSKYTKAINTLEPLKEAIKDLAVVQELAQCAHKDSEGAILLALKMVDHRNLTTHGYDEQLIEEISKSIPGYVSLLEEILQKTKL